MGLSVGFRQVSLSSKAGPQQPRRVAGMRKPRTEVGSLVAASAAGNRREAELLATSACGATGAGA